MTIYLRKVFLFDMTIASYGKTMLLSKYALTFFIFGCKLENHFKSYNIYKTTSNE